MAGFLSGTATGLGYASALANATGLKQQLLGTRTRVQFVGRAGVILQLDAVVSEEHTRTATVTKFPIEGGGTINDHVILAPPDLSITGIISDTPLLDLKALLTESGGAPLSGVLGPLGAIAGGTAYGLYKALQGAKAPSVMAFAQLCKIQAGDQTLAVPSPPEPIDVITNLQRYSSMVIESLTVPRVPANGGSLTFTVKMCQLNVVTPQTIPVKVFSKPTLAAPKQKLGGQEIIPVNGAGPGLAAEKAGLPGRALGGLAKLIRGG